MVTFSLLFFFTNTILHLFLKIIWMDTSFTILDGVLDHFLFSLCSSKPLDLGSRPRGRIAK